MHRVAEVPAWFAETVRLAILEGAHIHGNSEAVRAIAVDEAELAKWLPPRGRAHEVEAEHIFVSAKAASAALGFKHNEVARELGRVRRHKEAAAVAELGPGHTLRIRPSVTLRGVTFQYEKDVTG